MLAGPFEVLFSPGLAVGVEPRRHETSSSCSACSTGSSTQARRRRLVGHRHRAPPGGHGARRLDHRPRPRRRPRRRPDRLRGHPGRSRRVAPHPHRRAPGSLRRPTGASVDTARRGSSVSTRPPADRSAMLSLPRAQEPAAQASVAGGRCRPRSTRPRLKARTPHRRYRHIPDVPTKIRDST